MNSLLYLSILPSIILMFYIYKKDKVEKEPVNMLVRCFIGGVLSGFIVILLGVLGFSYDIDVNSNLSVLIYSFIYVGFIEEFIKLVIGYFITYKDKDFDYLYDSVLYMSFVSLGFAVLEGIIYIANTFDILVSIVRGITTLPGHVFFGIFIGYYLGLAKKESVLGNKKKENIYLGYAVIVPSLLHGFFDYCLYTTSSLGIILFCLFVGVLYLASFKKIKEISDNDKSLYE